MCIRYLTVLPVAENGTFTSHKINHYVEWGRATLTCDASYTSNLTESVVKKVQEELEWDPAYVNCVPKAS